jgi:hypothetical protein
MRLYVKGILVTVGLLFVGAGVGWATIPSSNGQISGCYHKASGALRVINAESGETCNANSELPISWNEAGPKGTTGPRGSTGPQGPTGDAGASGVVGYAMVVADGSSNIPGVAVGSHPSTDLDAQKTQTATAYCPEGKKVVGGGVDVSFAPGITLNASYPQNPWGATGPTEQDGGWTGVATIDTTGRLWNIKVYAFCASVTP